jgi:hypothetical protein
MQNNNKTSRVNLLFPFFKISRRIYLLWRRVKIFSNIYVTQSMSEFTIWNKNNMNLENLLNNGKNIAWNSTQFYVVTTVYIKVFI